MNVVIDQAQRDALIAAVERENLESPEQVADMAIAAAKRWGYSAGKQTIWDCVRHDNPQLDAMCRKLERHGDTFSGGPERVVETAREWLGYGFLPETQWIAAGFWAPEIAACLAENDVTPRMAVERAKSLQEDAFAGRDLIYEICNGDIDVDVLLAE